MTQDQINKETKARCERYADLLTDDETKEMLRELMRSKATLIKFHNQCLSLASLAAQFAGDEHCIRVRKMFFETAFQAVSLDVIMEKAAGDLLKLLKKETDE